MNLQNIDSSYWNEWNKYNHKIATEEASRVKNLINSIVECKPKWISDVRSIATKKWIKISDIDAIVLPYLWLHNLDI